MIHNSSSGQSLIEVVVVAGLIMLILVALVAGATVAIRNSQFSRTKARAMQLNLEAMEWIRGERKEGWSEFASRNGTFCLKELNFDAPGNCSSSDQFIRQAVLTKEGTDKIEVKLNTSWTDSNGEHNEEIITYLTKW